MKNILKKIGLFIILFITFIYKDLFCVIPLNLLNKDIQSFSYNTRILFSVIASFVFVLIILFIYRKYLKIKFNDFKKNISKYFDIGIKYWFIGILGMAIFNFLITNFSPIKEANNEALVQEMLNQAPLLSFISATILAPIAEEMLFRKSFEDIFKNKILMVFMSGLVFGLLHVIFSLKTPWDLLYIFPYGILGASFAYILYKTDNIYVPISFHMLHNGILTILSIVITRFMV